MNDRFRPAKANPNYGDTEVKRNLLTESDRCHLGRLLLSDDARSVTPRQLLDQLEWRLETAVAVQPGLVPDDLVTMNSTVRLVSVNSAAEMVCTIVYPEDVELVEDGISVLELLGTRLIGCEVGDLVEYEGPNNRGPWRVAEILFQPERAGEFHL